MAEICKKHLLVFWTIYLKIWKNILRLTDLQLDGRRSVMQRHTNVRLVHCKQECARKWNDDSHPVPIQWPWICIQKVSSDLLQRPVFFLRLCRNQGRSWLSSFFEGILTSLCCHSTNFDFRLLWIDVVRAD